MTSTKYGISAKDLIGEDLPLAGLFRKQGRH